MNKSELKVRGLSCGVSTNVKFNVVGDDEDKDEDKHADVDYDDDRENNDNDNHMSVSKG